MSITGACELIAWQERAGKIDLALQELLALKGDQADADLIKLHHDVAELNRPPFGAKQSSPVAEGQ